MKRALALIEQQKQSRGIEAQEESNLVGNSIKHLPMPRRNPSAHRQGIIDKNSLTQANVMNSDLNGMSSGKSTAISTTTRVDSSKGQPRVIRQNSDLLNKKDKYVVIETSISQQKKKPPHKLKPLTQKANDKLQEYLGEYGTSANNQLLQELEEDMKDYLNQDKLMQQMKSCFNDPVVSELSSQGKKTKKESKGKKKVGSELNPILEESKVLNQMVPYAPTQSIAEQRAKKNEALRQKVMQITQGDGKSVTSGEEKAETFMTACRQKPEEKDQQIVAVVDQSDSVSEGGWRPKGYYKYKEDELLDQVDFYEKEMNEMYKYLNEVEDLIKGNDLRVVEDMMGVAKEGMDQHFQAYDKIKEQLLWIDKQANEVLSEYEPSEVGSSKGKRNVPLELARIEEEKQAQSKEKASQEEQKKGIVDQLLNISQGMKDFSTDLENRLDKAYKSGAANKFGYNSLASISEGEGEKSDREDWKIKKLANQATNFLEKQGILASDSKSSLSIKSGAMKTVPLSKAGRKRS